jgi:hypothetical protein
MKQTQLEALFDAQDIRRHARSEAQAEMSQGLAMQGARMVVSYSPLRYQAPIRRDKWMPRSVQEALDFGEINHYGR